MKPIDLYDAMEGIPEKYIEAAKPAVKRRGESRTVTEQTLRHAEAVSTESTSRPVQRSSHSRKDSIRMSTKQPVWQRIATAFAATAACAVFVVGGMFIVQQAKQNQQQEDSGKNVQSVQNFLGGTGTIHTASDMNLMYDDDNFYFQKGQFKAKRGGGEIEPMQLNTYADDYLWDGEQFFREEGKDLYRIDMQGEHTEEKPFYTINTDAIQEPGTHYLEYNFRDIRKLTDSCYYISYSITAVREFSKDYVCIYQPETGQEDFLPTEKMPVPKLVSDGSDFVVIADTVSRISLNPVHIETLEQTVLSCNPFSNCMLANGCLYFMTANDDDSDVLSYSKFDLNTHQYTEIQHGPDFRSFIPYDGKSYAVFTDGSNLICADPEMNDIGFVWKSAHGLSTEQQIAADGILARSPGGASALQELLAADENYFLVMLDNIDASNGFVLIDRKTDKTQLFTLGASADDAEQSADDAEQSADTNILGGTGALHAADSNNWLLYDDSHVYLEYMNLRGERNPAGQIADSDAEWKAAYPVWDDPRLISDGTGTLYQIDAFSLYRLDETGNPEAAPFFTIPETDIRELNRNEGDADLTNISMEWLTEQYYHIFVQLRTYADTPNEHFTDYSYLFNAATGACSNIPGAEGQTIVRISSEAGGDVILHSQITGGGLSRFRTDMGGTYEEIPEPEHFIMMNGSALIQDDVIYYLSPGANVNFAAPVYCKYDLKTLKCEVITETPDFNVFIPYDGKLYIRSSDGERIYVTDPELKSKALLFDFERDTPDAVKKTALSAQNEYGELNLIPRVDAVDNNYLSARLADGTDLLIDRHTGTFRFYQSGTSADDAQSTAQEPQDPASEPAHSETENVFGGWGTLYPVDWDTHSAIALYRDDLNYYFFDSSDSQWYRCPLAGGQKEPLPARINGAQAPHEPFISDGERVYTRGLIAVSEGSANNAFDTTELRTYLNTLNNDAAGNGYYYECQYIWHLKNRYFMQITDGNSIGIEVWTDETGKILSHENAPADVALYFCNGEKTEMQAVRNNELYIVECPGDPPAEKPDPLAYGKILDAYLSMNGEYFYTADHELYTFNENGQKVLVTDRAFASPKLAAAPDHRFFYVNMDPLNFSLREWIGGSQDNEIYAPEPCSELRICGFEQTGNGRYNIVLSGRSGNNQSYIFVDAATGQAVKQIQ